MTPPAQAPFATPLGRRLAWIGALSLASGFPYGFVNEALPVYLRTHGADLVTVGLVQTASFPWTFKFLWAPFVDRFGARRVWILGCLAALAALVFALGAVHLLTNEMLFWGVVVLMVTLSATQDIAIDAYTIETTDTRELGVANSVRIAAYRAAMFAAGGLLVWVAGRADWPMAFRVGAAVCAGLAAAAFFLPTPATAGAAKRTDLLEPLRELLQRPNVWAVIAFALLFKVDVAASEPMARAFWVDAGLSLEEIGTVLTPGRLVATIAGATLGGLITTRLGIFRSLWSLGLLQAGSSLGFWWAATAGTKTIIYGATFFESFAAGLGTAAFVAFLMSVCEKRYAATQYAVLSALLALTRSAMGYAAGHLAEWLGYGPFFLATFFMGLPAFALMPWMRHARRKEA